ncbi:MAG: hypothetical protein DRR16_28050, partial [Candidatus Parabeggiatoa sp. nov. 3]
GYLYAHSDPVNLYDPTGEIAPIIGIAATQYARCIAACAATNVIANAIGGAACGFVENNCWSSCLNPLNWGGGRRPKLGKPRKAAPPQGCPTLNSFPAGTLVHTEKGIKPIEDIQIGEKVLSMDENTGKTSYQIVTDLIQEKRQYRLVEITLDSGNSIEATAEHPFYLKGKGWNPASSLKVGQILELHDGTVVVAEVLTRIRHDLVYNLTVANTHNYFVGEDGVLVHNVKVQLPIRSGIHDPTEGVLYDENDNEVGRFKSGKNPYSNDKTLVRGDDKIYMIQDHVEAQVAGKMVACQMSSGTLVINNRPCPGKAGCDNSVERMIPIGSKLRVIVPKSLDRYTKYPELERTGFDHTYEGK